MKTIQVLDENDIILPNDLVRKTLPLSAITQCTDDEGESTFHWQYAKWVIPAWIGKTQKQYRLSTAEEEKEHNRIYFIQLCIVRSETPNSLLGFLIAKPPPKVIQEMYLSIIKERYKGPI